MSLVEATNSGEGSPTYTTAGQQFFANTNFDIREIMFAFSSDNSSSSSDFQSDGSGGNWYSGNGNATSSYVGRKQLRFTFVCLTIEC